MIEGARTGFYVVDLVGRHAEEMFSDPAYRSAFIAAMANDGWRPFEIPPSTVDCARCGECVRTGAECDVCGWLTPLGAS